MLAVGWPWFIFCQLQPKSFRAHFCNFVTFHTFSRIFLAKFICFCLLFFSGSVNGFIITFWLCWWQVKLFNYSIRRFFCHLTLYNKKQKYFSDNQVIASLPHKTFALCQPMGIKSRSKLFTTPTYRCKRITIYNYAHAVLSCARTRTYTRFTSKCQQLLKLCAKFVNKPTWAFVAPLAVSLILIFNQKIAAAKNIRIHNQWLCALGLK